MPRNKRRLDKRLHSKHLDEVILEVLDNPDWRDALLALAPPDEIAIDCAAVAGKANSAAYLIRRHSLSYVLSVDAENECGDPEPMEDAKVFKLQAKRHPSVYVYAEELIDDIGSGAGY